MVELHRWHNKQVLVPGRTRQWWLHVVQKSILESTLVYKGNHINLVVYDWFVTEYHLIPQQQITIHITVGCSHNRNHDNNCLLQTGAHHDYTNPIADPICKFATSKVRWSFHSTSQSVNESPGCTSWEICTSWHVSNHKQHSLMFEQNGLKYCGDV